MVHLDYDDPPESIWIIRRYARFYKGYTTVELEDCYFVVDEEVRKKALAYPSTYKLLSGWVEGRLLSWDEERSLEGLLQVNYYPWERGCFFLAETGEPLSKGQYIYFHSDGKAYTTDYTDRV